MAELKFDKLDHTANAYVMQLDEAIANTEALLKRLQVARHAALEQIGRDPYGKTLTPTPALTKPATRDPLAAARAVDSSDKA